jgi:hypothetical protein
MIDVAAGLPCCAAIAGQAFVSVFWLQPCACTKWMPALNDEVATYKRQSHLDCALATAIARARRAAVLQTFGGRNEHRAWRLASHIVNGSGTRVAEPHSYTNLLVVLVVSWELQVCGLWMRSPH